MAPSGGAHRVRVTVGAIAIGTATVATAYTVLLGAHRLSSKVHDSSDIGAVALGVATCGVLLIRWDVLGMSEVRVSRSATATTKSTDFTTAAHTTTTTTTTTTTVAHTAAVVVLTRPG